MFKERELVKAKGVEDLQQEKHLWDSFIETLRQLQHGGVEKQLATVDEGLLQNNWVGLPNNFTTTQLNENNQTGKVNQQPVILEQVTTKKTL